MWSAQFIQQSINPLENIFVAASFDIDGPPQEMYGKHLDTAKSQMAII